MLFVVILIGLPLIVPLTTTRPRDEFRVPRQTLAAIPLGAYGVVGIVAALYLAIRAPRHHGRSSRDSTLKRLPSDALWDIPIEQCVRPEHGGNGLASRPLPLPSNGFLTIQTPGMEAAVIDGVRVVRRSQRMPFWKRDQSASKARRVLLNPQPCTVPMVKALSFDQLETTLTASVTYRVTDPRSALVQAPLVELTNLVQGVIVEHIHAHDQHDLLSDRGGLRTDLEKRLRDAKSLQGFQIVEVSILAVDGDRRLIEVGTQTRIEERRADLIHQQGMNKLQTADYDLKIEQLRLQLMEWAKSQDHNRLLDEEILRLNAGNVQAVIGAVSALAAQGQNPDTALVALQRLLTQQALSLPVRSQVPHLVIGEPKGEQPT
jgi:regulator of protease activity HflC (stomatin/prohibitin superfamily)